MREFISTEEIVQHYMPNHYKELQDQKENPDNDPGIAAKILVRRIMKKIKIQIQQVVSNK